MEPGKNFREKVKRTLPKTLKELRSRRKNIRGVVPGRMRNRAQAHESRLYSEYALLYDKTFGKIFYDRIKQVIKSLNIPAGARVLELGVGTGTHFLLILGIARSSALTWRRTCWSKRVQKSHKTTGFICKSPKWMPLT